MQVDDAVADTHDQLHAMLDRDDGALVEVDQVHLARLLRAHAGGRLVEEEQLRTVASATAIPSAR